MKAENIGDAEILEHYKKVAKTVGEMFSPLVEVIVHDLRNPKNSIIAIYNGHITGRAIGDSTSDLGYKRLRGEIPDEIISYENESPQGNKLKSSTLAIRNAEGCLLGSFSMNFDISQFEQFGSFVSNFISSVKLPFIDKKEQFLNISPKKEIEEEIRSILLKKNQEVHKLKKEEKKEIIAELAARNIFSKRGAIRTIAEELNLSRPSVYRYVKELESLQKN
jgi:predicted transcriptional regulator YheO